MATATDATTATLNAALQYAAYGWHILPLWGVQDGRCGCGQDPCPEKPGKHPYMGVGVTHADKTGGVLHRWFAGHAEKNLGIAAGASGLVMIDIDGPAGEAFWAEILRKAGIEEPSTLQAISGRPSGGRHLYFAVTEPLGTVLTEHETPGLSVRAGNMYVVAPPSMHMSGNRYRWATSGVRPASLPVVLRPHLEKRERKQQGEAASAPGPGRKYVPGQRGARIRELFGKLNSEGLPLELIVQAVLAENEACFEPPKTEAEVRDEVGILWQQYSEENGQAPNKRKRPAPAGEAVELPAVPEYPISSLTRGLRDLVQEADRAGLPAALAAAAGFGALSAAIGPNATIRRAVGWDERPILWPVAMAPRGAGKSPSQDLAFGPLRAHDAEVHGPYLDEVAAWRQEKSAERGAPPMDPTILAGDLNLESMARLLRGRPALAIDADELQQWILGLGEYKNRGGSGDRGRVLKLWSGEPWRYTRVGADGYGVPAIDILITRPTVTICGGLQPELSHLLGGEQDGQRPRWLLHLAAMPHRVSTTVASAPEGWLRLMGELLQFRDAERRWDLNPSAKRAFQAQREEWKRRARSTESASVSAALDKADRHLLRVTLDLAEAEHPAQGGEVPEWMVDRAIAAVEFTIDSWRALPEQGGLALSVKDERLDHGVDQLLAWLEQHGGRASKRDLLRAHAGGVRTTETLDQLLGHYAAVYPGTLKQEAPPTGGPLATVIYAPRRSPRVVAGDNDTSSPEDDEKPSAEYESGDGDNDGDNDSGGDNDGGDNDSGDNDQACRHGLTSTAYGVTTCLKCGQKVAA